MSTGTVEDETEFQAGGPCPCGFDPGALTLTDILAGLRTVPNRFRSALAVHLDDADPYLCLTLAPQPGAWSALEHAGHVRDMVHALELRISRLADREGIHLPDNPSGAPSGVFEQGPEHVLSALTTNVDALVRTLGGLGPLTWDRQGMRGGEIVSIADLATEALHESVHHLRDAAAAVEAARRGQAAVS